MAVIPARAGSVGLPGKNIRTIAGKPLLLWTIEAALKCSRVSRCVLTSDDPLAQDIARAAGCEVPFTRSAELSSSDATSFDVVLDVIARIPGYKYVVLLQPTSPLRDHNHITNAFDFMVRAGAPSCVSVREVRSNPMWMYRCEDDGKLSKFLNSPSPTRRQDLPRLVEPNGAIYIANIKWLTSNGSFFGHDTIGFQMDAITSLDIDDQLDFMQAESILSHQA